MRVLMVTCEWPTSESPHLVPFVVRQVEFLRKAGVDVDVFSFRGARNPINYLRAWYQVQKKLRQGSYDLVHAQWGQSAPVALPARLPLVVTFRGGEGEGIVGDDDKYTMSGYLLRLVSAALPGAPTNWSWSRPTCASICRRAPSTSSRPVWIFRDFRCWTSGKRDDDSACRRQSGWCSSSGIQRRIGNDIVSPLQSYPGSTPAWMRSSLWPGKSRTI